MARSSAQLGYGYRWQQARLLFLRQHPLCRMCAADGRMVAATVVDHITPHRGDQTLFWSEENWQPLCATHHSACKQAEEKRGRVIGCDANGVPLAGWK